jgi:hypothetical protein
MCLPQEQMEAIPELNFDWPFLAFEDIISWVKGHVRKLFNYAKFQMVVGSPLSSSTNGNNKHD